MEPSDFQRVYGVFPEPMLLLSVDGQVRAANSAAVALLGKTPEAHEWADEGASAFLARARRTRQFTIGTLRLHTASGALADFRAEGALLPPDSLLIRLTRKDATTKGFLALNERIDALNREVAQRRRAEQELQAQREWLRITLASIGDAVIATDEQGAIVLMNPVAEALTGWTLREAAGVPIDHIFRVVHEETRDPVSNPVERVLREGVVAGLANHSMLVARDETERPIDDSAAPIRDSSGNILGAVLVFRDVTDRRRTERELLTSHRSLERLTESLRQFAYAAAHDLQEPVRNVALYTQLLARRYQGQLEGDADRFILGAVEGATRIERLIRELLSYTRVTESGDEIESECDAEQVLREVIEHLHVAIEESNATVTHGRLPALRVFKPHLVQVLQNLISNALKYRGTEPPRIHVMARMNGRECVLSVHDNGQGIAPEHHSKVFKVFKRLHGRDVPGTGMGLAICERIVTHYGGRIWVESKPGEGAAFHFTMPSAPAVQSEAARKTF